jgi:hydrogenase maturation protein HypF
MLLEEAAWRGSNDTFIKPFDIPFKESDNRLIISTESLTEYIVSLIKAGEDVDKIAFAFHSSMCKAMVRMVELLREKYKINKAGLSGGVFQNRLMLNLLIDGLREKKFEIYTHQKVPSNDGCIAYGQIAIGKERCK